jgi:hypothetical protein
MAKNKAYEFRNYEFEDKFMVFFYLFKTSMELVYQLKFNFVCVSY